MSTPPWYLLTNEEMFSGVSSRAYIAYKTMQVAMKKIQTIPRFLLKLSLGGKLFSCIVDKSGREVTQSKITIYISESPLQQPEIIERILKLNI